MRCSRFFGGTFSTCDCAAAAQYFPFLLRTTAQCIRLISSRMALLTRCFENESGARATTTTTTAETALSHCGRG